MEMNKIGMLFTGFFLSLFIGAASAIETPVSWDVTNPGLNPASFREIWAYLMVGEERFLDASWPISDIGYFGAGLNSTGKLCGVPNRKIIDNFHGRVHLVVAEVSNAALTHFCIDPSFPMRDELIKSIASAAVPFDGVQIDFETVSYADRDNFCTFLTGLKKQIGNRTLSVALPARTRNVDDAYDYDRIGSIADRIVVMAYDEHWSGSAPGSIASLDWCKKVSSYALAKIGQSKLIMGMPFYGRSWGEINPSKAYKYSTLSNLISEKGISDIERTDEIPFFEYTETIKVRVYFEDARSVLSRALMYRDASVQSISFWRLGQEDSAVWGELKLEE